MKKILYLFGIFLLFILIVFPPALRIILPDKEEIKRREIENVVITILNCQSDKYISSNTYENTKIKRIGIKQLKKIETPETEGIEETENTTDNETTILDDIFSNLRGQNGVYLSSDENGISLVIDFTVSEYSNLDLSNIGRSVEDQKSFYEEQGLTCMIIK